MINISTVILQMPVYNWILFALIAIFTVINEGLLNEAFKYKSGKYSGNITFFGFKLFFGYFSEDEKLKNIEVYYRLTFVSSIASIILFIILYLNYFFNIILR